jgi:hypothetical protein
MHIQDFYATLVSETDNPFFAALRKLTLLDDPQTAFTGDNLDAEPWIMWVSSATPAPALT